MSETEAPGTKAPAPSSPPAPEGFPVGGPPPGLYECDMCAACCKQMKVELSVIDVLREPRLAPLARNAMVELVARDTMGQPVGPPLRRKALVMITGGPEGRCQFLGEAVPGEHPELCKMHPTRPGACVLFAAGSDECQKERRKMGLPPLLPVGQGPPAWKPPALSSLA